MADCGKLQSTKTLIMFKSIIITKNNFIKIVIVIKTLFIKI